ncbi:MAG: ankyrin repeat domain-containing protein [Nitrospiria bacterium]
MTNHKKEKLPPKWEFIAGGILSMLLISGSIGVLADDLEKEGRNITLEDAASAGDVKQIQSLLDKGTDVNERDKEGITPLHRAAGAGHLKAVSC